MALAEAIAPGMPTKIVGIRPGEKLHEVMISTDDAINTLEYDDYYVIQPAQPWWDNLEFVDITGGLKVKEQFSYSSENNDKWLSVQELQSILSGN